MAIVNTPSAAQDAALPSDLSRAAHILAQAHTQRATAAVNPDTPGSVWAHVPRTVVVSGGTSEARRHCVTAFVAALGFEMSQVLWHTAEHLVLLASLLADAEQDPETVVWHKQRTPRVLVVSGCSLLEPRTVGASEGDDTSDADTPHRAAALASVCAAAASPPEAVAAIVLSGASMDGVWTRAQSWCLTHTRCNPPPPPLPDIKGCLRTQGYEDVLASLAEAVLQPLLHAELYEAYSLPVAGGVLLHGPPGCGKTLLVETMAAEAAASANVAMVRVSGAELLSPFLGESERAVRELFKRARAQAPCIVFLDQIEGMGARRAQDAADPAGERLLTQLLTEMDGVGSRGHVVVIGCTSLPLEALDEALLRPGRLDAHLWVGRPSGGDRALILRALVGRMGGAEVATWGGDAEAMLEDVVARTRGLTGAALEGLVREAVVVMIREGLEANEEHDTPLLVLSLVKRVLLLRS